GPARSRRAGRPPAWFTRLGQPTLLAAAICVLVLVGVSIWTWTRPVPVAAPLTVSDPPANPAKLAIVAELVRTIDAKWEQGADSTHHAPRDGNFTRSVKDTMALRAGEELRLTSGLAEICFASGASVILEGSSTFMPQSNNSGRLLQGKLAAHVPPPAEGFAVHTERATITDLGTEFGVVVNTKSGQQIPSTEVHVFLGKVDVAQTASSQSEIRNQKSEILSAGQALRIDTQMSSSEVFAAEPKRFTRTLNRAVARDAFDDAVAGSGLDGHAGGSGWRGPWFTWSHPRRNKPSWQAGIGHGNLVDPGVSGRALAPGSVSGRALAPGDSGRAQLIGAGNPSYWWARAFEPIGDSSGAGKVVYLAALVQPEKARGSLELVAQGATDQAPAAIVLWDVGGQFAAMARPSKTAPPVVRDSAVNCEAGRTYRLVMKIAFSGDSEPDLVSVFVDPPVVEPATPDAVVDSVNLGNVDHVVLRQGVFDIDDIVVSDQWPGDSTPLPSR
ncbi:MAG: FecR family protein, partial [Planctomycetes bacterium]|nr:FecR family protein [Planctomycetota bacterium]